MSQYMVGLPDLVIPNAGTDSNILYERGVIAGGVTDGFGFRDADNIEIFAPATLPESVVVQVDSAFQAPPDNFDTLQLTPGTDLTIQAGKSIVIVGPSFRQLKLHATVAVGGARTFKVNKRVKV